VADFFSCLHVELGDAGRAQVWAGVAKLVRMRANDRLKEP